VPFDFAPAAPRRIDAAEIAGAPRHLLVEHVLRGLAPALRAAVAEIELTEAAAIPHMGVNLDQVAWRAVWRRPGLPVADGTLQLWNGRIL
jgi:hypothetical protein